MMSNKTLDLFNDKSDSSKSTLKGKRKSRTKNSREKYTAKDIEVLEGLDPVRKRPGMYIGGTDHRALHHLFSEVLDNAMDEVISGYAKTINITLQKDGSVTVSDDGRGIPVDPHPKFKKKSALEIIFTTLHSGGKFSGDSYITSGGLHGVGISVVNALSEKCEVEVVRDGKVWSMAFSRGNVKSKLKSKKSTKTRKGTTVKFKPDQEIFGDHCFSASIIWNLIRNKAYLFKGVKIRWHCDKEILLSNKNKQIPQSDTLFFPEGLSDYLQDCLGEDNGSPRSLFLGDVELANSQGRVEWAIAWDFEQDPSIRSFCNTIATPQGGTHEAGIRTALLKGIRSYGDLVSNKRAQQITAEDILSGAVVILSLFIKNPEFQGQTKERLTSSNASKIVEGSIRDHFDHWLSADPSSSNFLLDQLIEVSDERLRKKKDKEVSRKKASKRLRLPGKLADCTEESALGTELFIVEGDSAGGSAKQARNRKTQAVLPLRGKILNVVSATKDKLVANQELNDLIQALGCGAGDSYDDKGLRYEKIIIMTDADVDGAHIASLLMTFFYSEMPKLIKNGHLYIAQPPLYRMAQGAKIVYAMNDSHRDQVLKNELRGESKVEISRFKGLGEMPSEQLKETTMDPEGRVLLKVSIKSSQEKNTAKRVEELMGKKPELRLNFIQENATFVKSETLDI